MDWLRTGLNLGLLLAALWAVHGYQAPVDLQLQVIGDAVVFDLPPGRELAPPPTLLLAGEEHTLRLASYRGRARWVADGVLTREPRSAQLRVQGQTLDLDPLQREPPAVELIGLTQARRVLLRVRRPVFLWWKTRPEERHLLRPGTWPLASPALETQDWSMVWIDQGLEYEHALGARETLAAFAQELRTRPRPGSELEGREVDELLRRSLVGSTPLPRYLDWKRELLDSLDEEAEVRQLWNWFSDWEMLTESFLPTYPRRALAPCKGPPPSRSWQSARRERTPESVTPRAVSSVPGDLIKSQVFHELIVGAQPLPPPGSLLWQTQIYWPDPEDGLGEKVLFGLRIRDVPPSAWVWIQEMRVNGGGFHVPFTPSDCALPGEDWFFWSLPTRWMPAAGTLLVVQVRGESLLARKPKILSTSLASH